MGYSRSVERDYEIYKRYKAGETKVSIASDLGITTGRVNQIFKRAEHYFNQDKETIDKSIYRLALKYTDRTNVAAKITNVMNRAYRKKTNGEYGCIATTDFLNEMVIEDISQCYGLGPIAISIVEKMKAELEKTDKMT